MHIRKTMQLDSRHTPLAMQQPLADSTEIVIAYAGTNSNSLIDPDWATKKSADLFRHRGCAAPWRS